MSDRSPEAHTPDLDDFTVEKKASCNLMSTTPCWTTGTSEGMSHSFRLGFSVAVANGAMTSKLAPLGSTPAGNALGGVKARFLISRQLLRWPILQQQRWDGDIGWVEIRSFLFRFSLTLRASGEGLRHINDNKSNVTTRGARRILVYYSGDSIPLGFTWTTNIITHNFLPYTNTHRSRPQRQPFFRDPAKVS